MDGFSYLLLLGAGFGSGVINTLAGSGSLLSLPVLIFLGLPASVANGTNRIGILLQNIVSSLTFQHSRVLDLRGALLLSIPAVVGSILGASIAVNLDEVLMERAIGGVMLLMIPVIWLRPERWLVGRITTLAGAYSWPQALALFFIGIYGGFIQAGVGIFLLTVLVLSVGYDLVRANAIKVVIILAFTVTSLLVFSRNDQVEWLPGIVLGVGNMLGALVAARMAVKKGAALVRWVLLAAIAFSAAYFLGVFALVDGLLR